VKTTAHLWQDSGSTKQAEVVDFAGFNPFRDLPSAAHEVNDRQVVALAADVLGYSYPVLTAAVLRDWNLQMIGETEGSRDAASARALGKGMLRMALRDLTDFYVKLDRAESHAEPSKSLWPLVGTPAWLHAEMPDIRWKRGTTAPVIQWPVPGDYGANDNPKYSVDAA
jgi:hypothetical protein